MRDEKMNKSQPIVLSHLYRSSSLEEIFSDNNLVQKWLDVEAALARAEAQLGIIPVQAAQEISSNAQAALLNINNIGEGFEKSITIVPLLAEFKKVLNSETAEYVHWGATSQDILDTGMVLQLKEAHAEFTERLIELQDVISGLAQQHKSLVMAGRTQVMQALPITLGFKFAGWVSEIGRHLERLSECKKRLFVGQMSGAVGTLASWGDQGLSVQELTLLDLGLQVPDISWHSARDRIAEFVSLMGLVAGTLAKLAKEILSLQRTEIGEIEEPFFHGKVGSSTMPHKRNPQVCANVVAVTREIRCLVPAVLDCMVCENERDWTSAISEWKIVPQVCKLLGTALNKSLYLMKDLIIHPDNMKRNLGLLNGLILSEAITMKLAEKIGHMTAHEIMYETCMNALDSNIGMYEALMKNETITKKFSSSEIKELLIPEKYIGLAEYFVDKIVDIHQRRLEEMRAL
jgi:3-carboxy-cis,cis-muconate cycloisomerase